MKSNIPFVLEDILNKVIKERLDQSPEENRRSRLIWISSLITSFFCFFYTVISIFIDFKEGAISQGITFFLFIGIMFLVKHTKWSNNLISNLFLFFGYQSIAILPYFSGGIREHSYIIAWLAVVPVTASLVAKLNHAIIWYIICCLTLLYYLFFTHDLVQINYNLKYDEFFSVFTMIGLMLIMFLVNYTFKLNENKALHLIDKANKENIEQSILLKEAYEKLEEANKRVVDSIYYAKGIQRAILPTKTKRKELSIENFCFHRAKDVLSGDFYWVDKKGGIVYIAVVDCYEHGVAGAFKGLAIQNVLHESISLGYKHTTEIMDHIYDFFTIPKSNQQHASIQNIGITISKWDKQNNSFSYSTNNGCIFIKNSRKESASLESKTFINRKNETLNNFYTEDIIIDEPTMIYMYTDGFQKQLGGYAGGLYSFNRLNDLFRKKWSFPLEKQNTLFSNHFKQWQGSNGLTDDVLLFGLRIEPVLKE